MIQNPILNPVKLQPLQVVVFLVLVVCLFATAGVAAAGDFSVELENSAEVPAQSAQGIEVDRVALVEPGAPIEGSATAPSDEPSTVTFVTRNQSLEWNDGPIEGEYNFSIPTDGVETGTHVVGVATGLSEDSIEAAQPVVIKGYSISMSSADGFETTTASGLTVSATLSEHEAASAPVDNVEAVVWNETHTERVSMNDEPT